MTIMLGILAVLLVWYAVALTQESYAHCKIIEDLREQIRAEQRKSRTFDQALREIKQAENVTVKALRDECETLKLAHSALQTENAYLKGRCTCSQDQAPAGPARRIADKFDNGASAQSGYRHFYNMPGGLWQGDEVPS